MKKRNEIEEMYKWDLTTYFASDAAWENEYSVLSGEIKEICKFNNKLSEKQNILNCLLKNRELSIKIDKLYTYARLKVAEDYGNSNYIQMREKIRNLNNKYDILSSFITPELTKLSNDFLLELKSDSKFRDFSCKIDDIIRIKPHTLGEQEEKLLANVDSFSSGFSSVFYAFDSEIKFEDVINKAGEKLPLTYDVYLEYITSKDEVLRKSAFLNMHKKFGEFNNMLSMNYINKIKQSLFFAKSRNFKSSLDAALFYENASKKVYNSLIKAVNNKLPLFYKYYKIKAKALNIKKL